MILEREVTGGLAELARVAHEIEAFVFETGRAPRGARWLGLIVDELGSNAIRHGAAGSVTIVVELAAETLTLHMRDNGRPFDPRGVPKRRADTEGGRGLELVKALASITEYVHESGLNSVTLLVHGRHP